MLVVKKLKIMQLSFEVSFRTDNPNLSDDYQRNRIRHHLIPLLQELTPGFHSRMRHNLFRLQKEWNHGKKLIAGWANQYVKAEKDSFSIDFDHDHEGFLLRWLEEKGIPWNLSSDFIASMEGTSGNSSMGKL